jgi:sec-independent protein translocase protein TatB
MNFLGMGPLELMLIVVLALIVFGPAKLPEIMGQVGRAIGDFRRATSELSDEFNRTIQAELNETKQTIEETKAALTEVRTAVDSTMNETRAAVAGTPAPQRVAAPTLETAVANGTSHDDSVTNGATTESSPPLADTSQWSWETAMSAPEASASADEGRAAASDASAVAEAPAVEAPPMSTNEAHAVSTNEAHAAPAVEDEATPAPETTTSPTPPHAERVARDELQPPY